MKIVEYFFNRKITTKNRIDIKEIGDGYWYATIYTKLPFMKKYCVWSTYDKNIESANAKAMKAIENNTIVKDEMSLVEYINRFWYMLKESWLNIIDIIDDGDNVLKKSKCAFKRPVKKWYWGFGSNKRVFRPFDNSWINPILYFNKWSLSWKPKYDYVCFEDNPQMWFCFFRFFWFGYRLVSPVEEDFEDSYWEQMIWYVNYSDCDLKKAEDTYFTTWEKKYLIDE